MRVDHARANALALNGIYEASKILSSSLNLESTLRDVLNLLSSYMLMRRGMVALVDKDAGAQPVVIAAAGMTPQALERGEARLPKAVVDAIMTANIPHVVADMAGDPMFAGFFGGAKSRPDQPVAFIGVPIKAADKPIGVLTIERDWDDEGDVHFEFDVRFLAMIANLIGQTARLRQNIATDRERLLIEQSRLQKALDHRRHETRDEQGGCLAGSIVGQSRVMQEVLSQVRQVAQTRSTVLIRGESGTGKELIARAIHQASQRAKAAFVEVNCAALPENLLESELFGHEKGAFTGASHERKGRFELADGGTLFLDEIGEISPAFQAKLLRVLQEGEFERVGGNKTIKVDVRLISATNKNLEEAVANGTFRADLYYRISVVPVLVPPLRDRPEDISKLAGCFLTRFNKENKRDLRLSDEALAVLQHCYFPGNVRELENCVSRVATMAKAEVIRASDMACQRGQCLSSALWKHRPADARPVGGLGPAPAFGEALASCPLPSAPPMAREPDRAALSPRDRLIQAMETAGWVQAKAARMLGLTPRQIGYALKKYGVEVKQL
ncbi:MAG: nif-specific transcriptional activator NifA [Magnetospirillum sp. WYHS-4]